MKAPLPVLLVLYFTGCDALSPAPTPRELCRQRADLLAQLYSDYGGHPLLVSAAGEQAPGGAASMVDELMGAAAVADQSNFDESCRAVGAGGKADVFVSKARAFFAREDVRSNCRKVVDLEDLLVRTNAKLPSDQRVACP